ncbi:hypothetical protein IAR55_004561 [Kwoniella newhampshirensis]|uniref:Uncharacterized protein n=1 Tax=Kwoniella newhampshirensis TaxID=1651941 RepID=A0AAW0YXW5_9TREE
MYDTFDNTYQATIERFVYNCGILTEHPSRTHRMTPEDLDKRAKELGVMSIETSAKAGYNVKTLFKKIAMSLPGGSSEEVPQASGCQC